MESSPTFVIRLVRVRAGVEQGSEDGVIVVPGSPVERGLVAVVARLKVSAGGQQCRGDGGVVVIVGGGFMERSVAVVVSYLEVSAGVDQCLDYGGAGAGPGGNMQRGGAFIVSGV